MLEIKIFIITLRKHYERQAFIQRRMEQLGLEFEFFYGVDGELLSDAELNDVDQEFCYENYGHTLSLGEIGCALSHIKLYEKIRNEKIERALILEDDAFLLSITPSIIQALPVEHKYELVYLYNGKAKKYLLKKKMPHNYKLVRYRRPTKKSKRCIISTVAYIVTYGAVKKLLEIAYPVRMPSDYLTGYIQLNNLKAFGVEPCCVDTGYFETTIKSRDYGAHVTVEKD